MEKSDEEDNHLHIVQPSGGYEGSEPELSNVNDRIDRLQYAVRKETKLISSLTYLHTNFAIYRPAKRSSISQLLS